MMIESIADCVATMRIRYELDNGHDVALRAVQHLVKNMMKIRYDASTIDSRKLNIMSCLGTNKAADACVECVLRHHKLK